MIKVKCNKSGSKVAYAQKFTESPKLPGVTYGVWNDGPFEGKKKAYIEVIGTIKLLSLDSYVLYDSAKKVVGACTSADFKSRYSKA